jgi:hypothetical protein
MPPGAGDLGLTEAGLTLCVDARSTLKIALDGEPAGVLDVEAALETVKSDKFPKSSLFLLLTDADKP